MKVRLTEDNKFVGHKKAFKGVAVGVCEKTEKMMTKEFLYYDHVFDETSVGYLRQDEEGK